MGMKGAPMKEEKREVLTNSTLLGRKKTSTKRNH